MLDFSNINVSQDYYGRPLSPLPIRQPGAAVEVGFPNDYHSSTRLLQFEDNETIDEKMILEDSLIYRDVIVNFRGRMPADCLPSLHWLKWVSVSENMELAPIKKVFQLLNEETRR